MKNKRLIIGVVAALATLLGVIGISYSYFASNMNGTAANASVTTARVGTVSFQAEEIDTTGTKVLPGWISGAKSLEIGMSASDVTADYTCTLTFTSRVADLYLKVENVSGTSANTTYSSYTQINSNSVVISSGTLAGNQTDEVNYYLQFKETGLEQNTQMSQSIVGTVSCSITSNLNYTTPVSPQYYAFFEGNIGMDAPLNSSPVPPSGKKVYIGYDIVNNKISAAYACFIRNQKEYCLKGGDGGYAYEYNQTVLEEAYKNTSACSFDEESSSCSENDPLAFEINVDIYGSLGLYYGPDTYCDFDDGGYFGCGE